MCILGMNLKKTESSPPFEKNVKAFVKKRQFDILTSQAASILSCH